MDGWSAEARTFPFLRLVKFFPDMSSTIADTKMSLTNKQHWCIDRVGAVCSSAPLFSSSCTPLTPTLTLNHARHTHTTTRHTPVWIKAAVHIRELEFSRFGELVGWHSAGKETGGTSSLFTPHLPPYKYSINREPVWCFGRGEWSNSNWSLRDLWWIGCRAGNKQGREGGSAARCKQLPVKAVPLSLNHFSKA